MQATRTVTATLVNRAPYGIEVVAARIAEMSPAGIIVGACSKVTGVLTAGTVISRDRESGNPAQSELCSAVSCPCRLEAGSSTAFTMLANNSIVLVNSTLVFASWQPEHTVQLEPLLLTTDGHHHLL